MLFCLYQLKHLTLLAQGWRFHGFFGVHDQQGDVVQPLISVVICTFNRADLLANVLKAVCNQTLTPEKYEVLIVDNNSTDATHEVAKSFIANHSNLRYIVEVKQGLSHARNRGWQASCGEYVAYTDDDCEPPREWLAVAKRIIDERTPEMFGGPDYAFYSTPKPAWFKDSYGSSELSTTAVFLNGQEFLGGSNMFFRRDILEKFAGFDVNLGVTGNTIIYGEDVELQCRIREHIPEARTYYDPSLFVYHLVRPEQMTLSWQIKAAIGKGRYRYLVAKDQKDSIKAVLLLKAVKVLLSCGIKSAGGLLFRDRSRYPNFSGYLYEQIIWRLAGLGKLYEQYRDSDRKLQKVHPLETG